MSDSCRMVALPMSDLTHQRMRRYGEGVLPVAGLRSRSRECVQRVERRLRLRQLPLRRERYATSVVAHRDSKWHVPWGQWSCQDVVPLSECRERERVVDDEFLERVVLPCCIGIHFRREILRCFDGLGTA